MMYPHHYYTTGFGGIGILPILIILGVIFLLWAIFAHRGNSRDEEMQNEDTALQILRERYAKGEITKRQFDQMKKDIG